MQTFSICSNRIDLRTALERVLQDVGVSDHVGESVFIKPNFTYPFFKPGVTTTRELLVELVSVLKEMGCRRITIGEGEGGYNAFSMDETFRNFRLEELTQRFGVEVVNVAAWPSLPISVRTKRGPFEVHLPRPIFEEFDSFISVPVPKVHVMTTVSNAIKNQWGLIQDVMRLKFHLGFNEIIAEITGRLPTPFALVDGTYGLTKSGPMLDGESLDLGWVSACDDLWLNDVLVCRLMGVDPHSVAHLEHGLQRGLAPAEGDYRVVGDFQSFEDDRFYLQRNAWNRMAKLTWSSPGLNHLVYFSGMSSFLHKVMYSIRSKPEEIKTKGTDWR